MTPVYNLARFRQMVAMVKPSDRRGAIRDLMILEEAYQCADQSEALRKRAKQLVDAALEAAR